MKDKIIFDPTRHYKSWSDQVSDQVVDQVWDQVWSKVYLVCDQQGFWSVLVYLETKQ